MSANTPRHLIVAVFGTQAGAEAARKALGASRDGNLIGICASIAVQKDIKGQIHLKDPSTSAGKGVTGGSVLGVALGVLTGGSALVLGAAGALVGGLAGKRSQATCAEEELLNQLAASLVPGSSALIVVMQPGWGVVVEKELKGMGAHVFTADIPVGTDQDPDADRETAYTTLLSRVQHTGNEGSP